ncbi:hypothetical protein SOPP22_12600 [Shewanella sp. OPT22]|nr:hypothetical protein SOPP22_12600 [Shewanella sp. OPT22]
MNQLLKSIVFVIFVFPLSLGAQASSKAGAVFNKMKTLVGTWKKEGQSHSDFTISFELTANNSTLLEIWNYKGKKHSLTVYHQNGEKLMATHYCPQGNQPRLELTESSTMNAISFRFFDATNLESLDKSHQHYLGFEFPKSMDRVVRSETYTSYKGEKESVLILVKGDESS